MSDGGKLLIRGGQVYDHDGNVHKPEIADVLIEGGDIVAVGKDLAADGAKVIDARDHLVMPGLINAHYHSHDTLCRGMFEELPLELWFMYTVPLGANRSKEEVRARTLVGALESLRAGITTVQDMLGLAPLREDYVDVVLSAYKEAGIRVVFAPMVADLPPLAMVRYGKDLPEDIQELFGNKALARDEQIGFLDGQFRRHPAAGNIHWAVAPFAPQRCTPRMLRDCADLADKHDLAVYTHVYETRGQALIGRDLYPGYGGSLINYLDSEGLLSRRLNIAHSVWISRPEMERMASAGAGVVLNHLSNLKLKSGIAPVSDLRDCGVRLGLGCDNCSGSDVQSMFQAMKLFCLFAAVSEPEPGPGLAQEAVRHATLGNARTAGLQGKLGAVRPGHKADLVLIDLKDVGYLPFNSAARQLVYTEAGRGVDTVIVDGKIVIEHKQARTIDEDGLRREVADLMRHFVADHDRIVEQRRRAVPHLLAAHRQVWERELEIDRFIPRTRN
jgi:5-methylthioadenosine/S-adenosylhomocysteine deaminase